jgi:hypothetical protein
MLRRLSIVIALILLSVVSALAADVSGKWKVKITTPDGEVIGVAQFWQDGNRVTGWLGPSESDPISITTALDGNKLTIWTHPQPGRNVVFARCDVSVESARMTGTIDTGRGKIEFVRIAPTDAGR